MIVKNTNKSQREMPVAPEEQKYKKKSSSKGLPRSKHKHQYKDVLWETKYSFNYGKGEQETLIQQARKVCTICGRLGDTANNYYFVTEETEPIRHQKTHLSPEAMKLEKWVSDDFFSKFATRAKTEVN